MNNKTMEVWKLSLNIGFCTTKSPKILPCCDARLSYNFHRFRRTSFVFARGDFKTRGGETGALASTIRLLPPATEAAPHGSLDKRRRNHQNALKLPKSPKEKWLREES